MDSDRYLPLDGRAVLALSGDEARPFLQGLITNDMDAVSADRAIYAALLTPQGKFLHDFFIAELDGRLLLETAAGRAEDLLKRLKMYRLRAKVEIDDISEGWKSYVLLPGSDVAGAAEPWRDGIVFTDPRHAALGARNEKVRESEQTRGPSFIPIDSAHRNLASSERPCQTRSSRRGDPPRPNRLSSLPSPHRAPGRTSGHVTR